MNIFLMAKKNCERTWEREVRTVLLTLNLDADAYLVQRYLVEIYVFINGESNSSNKEAITSKVGERIFTCQLTLVLRFSTMTL